MILTTNRLILRYLKDDDLADVYFNYANDDEVTKYLSWPTHNDLSDTKRIFDIWKNEDEVLKKYHYFLVLKDSNKVIGSICVVDFINNNPEIGIVIGRKYWRCGLMSEALEKMIELLFNDGYSKIIMKAHIDNVASNKIIQKFNFKYTGQEIFNAPLKRTNFLVNVYELNK